MTDIIKPENIIKNQLFLYSDDGYDSHVVRFLLAEKKIDYKISCLANERPEDLADINPYRTLPVLIHADIVLYEINVIFEYLEERYHNNKLLPESPQRRAEVRQLAWRIQNDWLRLGRHLLMHPDSYNEKQATLAKKQLTDSLITIAPIFNHKSFFLSDELSWCDILLIPLLWQLDNIDVILPQNLAAPLLKYQEKMFERTSFQQSIYRNSLT